MELVNSLPDEQRICLVYYAVEEMKISEIADLLEVSESTVKSRLKYAKGKMKAKIEDLEKKGIKLRGLSGLAIIPFVYHLFAIESKAAIPAAVSFGPVAVGVPVAVYQVATNDDAVVSSHHSESSGKKGNGSNKHGGSFVQDGYVNEVDELNAMIDFDEMVILDTEDYSVKVLNVRIDEAYNYILESEATNKLGNDIRIFSYPCFIDGVYSNVEMSVEVEANKTEKFEIKVHNPDLINYHKKFSEIKLRLQHTEYEGRELLANHDSVYAEPIYPFGVENKKEFEIGNNYKQQVYTDDDFSIYVTDYLAVETYYDEFFCTLVLYLENKTDEKLCFAMDNLMINDEKVSIHYIEEKTYDDQYLYNVSTSYDEAYVPQNGSVFYKIAFRNKTARDDADIGNESEIETVTFDVKWWKEEFSTAALNGDTSGDL